MTDTPTNLANVSPWKAAFSSRGFLIVVGVLALAAVGLNSAAQALDLYFKKQPVPLRHALADEKAGVPKEMGDWVAVQQTNSLDEDVQHVLGTDQFVFRTYVNRRLAGGEVTERLVKLNQEVEALDPNDKAQAKTRAAKMTEWAVALRRLQAEHPEAVMSFAVTYYTGMVDTVAHVPEVCMVADGFQPTNPQQLTWHVGEYPGGSPRQIEVRFQTFEDQTGHGRVSRNVAYMFHCNGGYEPSPVGVRGKLQNLFERHGYYAKVELMTDEPIKSESRGRGNGRGSAEGAQKSIEAMTDMLSVALPEVERCLPDWAQVKAGGAGGGKTAVAAK